MKILTIINDAPYGTEKAYNALRMVMTLQKENPEVKVLIFLLADSVACAIPNQKTPQGYYNIERMLTSVIKKGAKVKACGGCSEARGISEMNLIEGTEISNMKEFSNWVVEADKVLAF
jgi:uncharacterized protein involved in oxidation of intracellular sulfur